MVADKRLLIENLTLKAVTYAITPVAVLPIGLALVSKGRVGEALAYIGRDWRQSI